MTKKQEDKKNKTSQESVRPSYEYSIARDAMFMATDIDIAPWHIVTSDDKRRPRLNCIQHLLSCIAFEDVPREKVKYRIVTRRTNMTMSHRSRRGDSSPKSTGRSG